ncbi:hypothetical protein [Streptomyces boncukensis]|uniref:Secreted protein n=1 Tax=Streptomyces boncukensis TaxID=2711219 RepID=A0A6G4WV94_9ACTN|nr:hypothetical protein [Streptomyces boncukensis]NGO68391.1 hypothetical protein [Streptomyces boncukensis]
MTITNRSPHTRLRASATAGALAAVLLSLAPHAHAAGGSRSGPSAPEPPAPPKGAAAAAHRAAADDGTLRTLSRFFARDGAVSAAGAQPRVTGRTVPVYTLSADFVAASSARSAATTPVARLALFASAAVASDGQRASVMSARTERGWRVVNIATGDDETRYAAKGAARAPGGTVFQEPQIDAWYVQDGARVLPLDRDARKAVGADGTSLRAYQQRVHDAYGDKLPGSAYDKKGLAGGFGPRGGDPQSGDPQRVASPESAGNGSGSSSGSTGALGAVGASAVVLAVAAGGGGWLARRRVRSLPG